MIRRSLIFPILAAIALVIVIAAVGWVAVGLSRSEHDRGDRLVTATLGVRYRSDVADYNASLAARATSRQPAACPDADLCATVAKIIDAMEHELPVKFHLRSFVQACVDSPFCELEPNQKDIPRIHQVLQDRQVAPTPLLAGESTQVIGMRVAANGRRGTVDLLIGDPVGSARSHQWYFAKIDQQWELYDWQRMEFGRRVSDQYAVGLFSKPTGAFFDFHLAVLDANERAGRGDRDFAERLSQRMMQCEAMPLADQDQPHAKFLLAEAWIIQGRPREAIRVLESLDPGSRTWGHWLLVAYGHLTEGNVEQGLVAAHKAQQASPHHPNIHTMIGFLHEQDQQIGKAIASIEQTLRVCPDHATLLRIKAKLQGN